MTVIFVTYATMVTGKGHRGPLNIYRSREGTFLKSNFNDIYEQSMTENETLMLCCFNIGTPLTALDRH